ncbi:MAG: AsmA family protein [Anaerolineae bacterium]
MKGFFKSISGWLAIIIIVAIIIAMIGWSRVPDILAQSFSKKMKVSVQIDDINLRWDAIHIDKVEIGNPPGSILPKALGCEHVDIIAPLFHYLKKFIEIDQIALDTIYLGLEFDSQASTNGNWTTIMNNFKESERASSKNQKASRKVLIKKLILTNISIDLVYRKDGGKIKKLPPIKKLEFTNVTSEGGIPLDQMTDAILTETLRSIFQKENLKDMLQNILENEKGPFNKFVEPFKKFLNMTKEEKEAMSI